MVPFFKLVYQSESQKKTNVTLQMSNLKRILKHTICKGEGKGWEPSRHRKVPQGQLEWTPLPPLGLRDKERRSYRTQRVS